MGEIAHPGELAFAIQTQLVRFANVLQMLVPAIHVDMIKHAPTSFAPLGGLLQDTNVPVPMNRMNIQCAQARILVS